MIEYLVLNLVHLSMFQRALFPEMERQYLSRDRALRLVDRVFEIIKGSLEKGDDVLISGGENIHPAVVEAVFSECPGVQQAAVTAVDDIRWGDALVLLYEGTALPETVKRWARGRLRAGFLPRYFVPVDELPRNALGKLLRSALKPIARERLQSQNA